MPPTLGKAALRSNDGEERIRTLKAKSDGKFDYTGDEELTWSK